MGTVQKACEVLNLQGLKIDLSKVSKQMKKTLVGKKIKGRWQVLQESPLVIADAALNENGIKALTKQLAKMDCKSLHIVFGTVNDKDPSNILSLMPKLATYYFCKADIPRGMNAIELKDYASKHGLQGSSYTSVMGAFEAAKSSTESEDLVLVTRSIFVIAEVV